MSRFSANNLNLEGVILFIIIREYYNLSCIFDKETYKKIFFSPHETHKLEENENGSGSGNGIPSETNYTYISNSLFDFLSRFKKQIELKCLKNTL